MNKKMEYKKPALEELDLLQFVIATDDTSDPVGGDEPGINNEDFE